MGCGCNKAKKTVQTFALKMPDGSTSEHGSRLEAEATNARKGGGGKVVARPGSSASA